MKRWPRPLLLPLAIWLLAAGLAGASTLIVGQARRQWQDEQASLARHQAQIQAQQEEQVRLAANLAGIDQLRQRGRLGNSQADDWLETLARINAEQGKPVANWSLTPSPRSATGTSLRQGARLHFSLRHEEQWLDFLSALSHATPVWLIVRRCHLALQEDNDKLHPLEADCDIEWHDLLPGEGTT